VRGYKAILKEAASRGLHGPRSLSVVGFDDASEAAMNQPPLTTVAQPLVEKERHAARLLFNGAPQERIILPIKLVVRGSTGPAVVGPQSA